MTARTWQGTGSATAPVANGTDAGSDRSAPFSWDDWFRHASALQRADALGLARQQGLLYPHQLPVLRNGIKPASPTKEIDPSPSIARLLAGKADGLPRLSIDALTIFDADLDDLQRQAVARAVATPDLFMLQGLPGVGKSRVLAEIVLQAAVRGWRVLLLAGQTASVDVILERLVGRQEVLGLRMLDALEKPASLPGWLRGFTLEEQKQAFVARTVAAARRNHEQTESACKQRRDQEPHWAELQACAERCRDLDQKLQALQSEFAGIAATVEREAESGGLADLRHGCDEALREVDAVLRIHQDALARSEQEATDLAAQIAARESAYLAKKNGRFWTLAYWLNLFNGHIIREMETLVEQHAKSASARQELARQINVLNEQRHRRNEQFQHERAAHLAGEILVRQQKLQTQQHAIAEDLRRQETLWTDTCRRLDSCPAARTPEAIASAQEAWQRKKLHDEQQCQFAQQWTKFVHESGADLATRLPSFANLVAGSIQRWHADAKTRDAAGAPFDLLIVEDAESLTEADLLKLSRYAPRCVLAAQSLAEPTPAPTVAEKASRALLPAPLVSAACWTKVWHTLGGDAGRWPCVWHREQGRMVCQLMPLSADDAQHLESEGLADAPDIELRILHRPRTQPCLAQVIFTPQCTFHDAFSFMMREVQEFPLQPLGRTAWWSEDAERHRRHLGPNAPHLDAWLEVEAGVRLGSAANQHHDTPRIACIEFDKAAGWDRMKAEAWLHRHRPAADHERTVLLQMPYRFARPLVKLVQAVVREGDWVAPGPSESSGAQAFEFIAAPPFSKPEWPREGAGLELDLSATRHADRLPVGLRPGLPARGFVNYLEAQALIRRLESWSQTEGVASSRVAVLALYESQVELLRRLVEQSEILRARNFPLEIALPSRLHQRECDVVFLSLTRSHAHRCVAFGEDVKELPLALTRARLRLLVFGDPGALYKRTTWNGPLEHLDAPASQQDLVRCARLLAYLQQDCHFLPLSNGVATRGQ